ncbi:FlgD immunoglobulin-like domain containing protein [Clostridium sp.]|jgi:flagellar hook assembly protein FlgD|uniref:FlgD immunoglobulin-like domain containing protein n=1 Tax=Clostridium sp. TaxID=1506 RepID=UPI003EEBA1F1
MKKVMKNAMIIFTILFCLNTLNSYGSKIYATKSEEILSINQVVLAGAQDLYSLKDGEVLLDKRDLSSDKVEVFTKIKEIYYRKILENIDGNWVELESNVAQVKYTGLKGEEKLSTNHAVEKALEDKLQANGLNLNQLPSKLDYSNLGYFPPIGNQQENSCVAWAAGYYLRTFQQAKDIGWGVGSNARHIFSTSFIYNQINGGVDEGATLNDAGNLLKNEGAATLYDFPYVAKDYLTQPSSEVIQKSGPNKIRDWYVLYTNNDSSDYIVQKTKEYLNTGDLPIVGMNVGFKWMYPLIRSDGTSIVTTENYILGGHAVVVVGYEDNLVTPEGYGAFKIINSYGTNWGQQGYTYMTYEAFAKAALQGFVFTDLVNGEIVDEMGTVTPNLVSEDTLKFTWGNVTNASGYKVLDENLNIISIVYSGEYIEKLQTQTYVKRYFQAFNSISSSNVVSAEIDLSKVGVENLETEVQDTVDFRMNFTGSGRYDLEIKDENDTIIKEMSNNQGSLGLNIYTWNGEDVSGNIVPEGNYRLEVIPYKGQQPKDSTITNFVKKSKLVTIDAEKYELNGNIYKAQVDVKAKESGKVSVYFVKGDKEEVLIKDSAISAGEIKTFSVSNTSTINLNEKGISIKLVVN